MERDDPRQTRPPPPRHKLSPLLIYFLVAIGLFWFLQSTVSRSVYRELSYSEFKGYLSEGAVTNAVVSPDTRWSRPIANTLIPFISSATSRGAALRSVTRCNCRRATSFF